MDRDKRKQIAEVSESIGEILLKDWDPIGVKEVVEAQDEYEGYIGEIYRLLSSGASELEIGKHLAMIEEQQMGLGRREPQTLKEVARKLLALKV